MDRWPHVVPSISLFFKEPLESAMLVPDLL
jgi:hypothetical protein